MTDNEIHTLAASCFALTVELAVRFLDDYILGSPYFRIEYPEHNLVRARCQIALAKDMLLHMGEMEDMPVRAMGYDYLGYDRQGRRRRMKVKSKAK